MAAAPLATLEDVADVAGTIPSSDEARIMRLVAKVSAWVRRYTGHDFQIGVVEGETSTVYPVDGQARLPHWPVSAVASVTSNGTAVAAGLYEWTASGVVRLTPQAVSPIWPNWSGPYPSTAGGGYMPGAGLWAPGPMVLVYDWGYDEVPPDVALVVAEVVADKYRSPTPGQNVTSHSEQIDGYSESVTYGSAASSPGGWSPSHRAVLDVYRRGGFRSVRLAS